MLPVLWSISYSPWSDQARWALDACGVEYRRRAYRPLLDELALRRALRRWSGPVSVPILVIGDAVIADSFDIARWADQHATAAARLVPADLEPRIRRYNALAQRGLAAGRALGLARMLDDDDALAELAPPALRKRVAPVAIGLARFGVRRTLRKYAAATPAAPAATLIEILDTLRDDLRDAPAGPHGIGYLLGAFTWADIAMAQVLAFVDPPATHLRLSAGSRRAYHDVELASRYADLVHWRDTLYRECRSAEATRSRGTHRPGT